MTSKKKHPVVSVCRLSESRRQQVYQDSIDLWLYANCCSGHNCLKWCPHGRETHKSNKCLHLDKSQSCSAVHSSALPDWSGGKAWPPPTIHPATLTCTGVGKWAGLDELHAYFTYFPRITIFETNHTFHHLEHYAKS